MDELYRQRLLLDVKSAEKEASPFLRKVQGLSKLLVSDSFHSFGGLSDAPALSSKEVDSLPKDEKQKWIACRLWAICQKIRNVENPPAQAGVLLERYRNWLQNPTNKYVEAGAKGGSKSRAYSADLEELIKKGVVAKGSANTITIFQWLIGERFGCIDRIETEEDRHGEDRLLIPYTSADRPLETFLSRSALDKRLKKYRNK